jgi:hypothetical protein
VRKFSRQYPVPTSVVEFLLGRYCVSTDPAEIEEGLQIVEKQLQGRTVRPGEEELFKARSRDQGSVKIIDLGGALSGRDIEGVNKTVSECQPPVKHVIQLQGECARRLGKPVHGSPFATRADLKRRLMYLFGRIRAK